MTVTVNEHLREMERIKHVKAYTSDLTNKMRKKVNMLIDAVNS